MKKKFKNLKITQSHKIAMAHKSRRRQTDRQKHTSHTDSRLRSYERKSLNLVVIFTYAHPSPGTLKNCR